MKTWQVEAKSMNGGEMKIFSAFALAVMLTAVTAQAGEVYLDDNLGQLYAGDPTTADYTYIGTSAAAAGFGGFTDIDFVGSTLYGLDRSGNLYTINTSNGQIISEIGSTNVTDGSLVGLAGSPTGVLWAGGNNQVFKLNLGTGAATQVGTTVEGGAGGYTTEGDLDFVGSSLYLTSTRPSGGHLFSISLTTGVGTDLGQLADPNISQTFTDVFGVAYDTDNGVLYGYDVSDDQFQINTANPGQSTLNEATFNETGGSPDVGGVLGAAFIASPEPSTFVLIGSALILLAVGLRRKANRTA
jgi:hypothetical protein